jgi:CheY-like chemotaxis protein
MRCAAGPATVLVVEPDVVLGRVLSKVLARQGLRVVHAVGAPQALRLVEQVAPRVVLLDCCLRDDRGLKLAADLHRRYSSLPLILMCAYALGPEALPGARHTVRVLLKPLDLPKLRQAVDAALAISQASFSKRMVMQTTTPLTSAEGNRQPAPVTPSPAPEFKMENAPPAPLWQRIVSGVIVVLILGAFSGYVLGVQFPGLMGPRKDEANKGGDKDPSSSPVPGVSLVKDRPHTLAVPEEARTALGIRRGKQDLLAVAQPPTAMKPLVLPGSTALDPTRLARIRARFAPARVVEIGQTHDLSSKTGRSEFRELRPGDHVRKGDVLGVFYSVDVGSKKNDLLDALVQVVLAQGSGFGVNAQGHALPPPATVGTKADTSNPISSTPRLRLRDLVSPVAEDGSPDPDGQFERPGAAAIYREQGKRLIAVKFSVHGRDLGSVVDEGKARIKDIMEQPPYRGVYRAVWAGEIEQMEDANHRLLWIIPLSLGLIFILLYCAFHSFLDAVVVLSNVLDVAVGGIWALYLTGTPFSVAAAVGFVSLFGIAIMEGLLLISYFNVLRIQGLPLHDAIIQGTLKRVRPVMITAMTAILGLLPAALSTKIGAQTARPLAIVVVGGMAVTLLLDRYLMPVLYTFYGSRQPPEGAANVAH